MASKLSFLLTDNYSSRRPLGSYLSVRLPAFAGPLRFALLFALAALLGSGTTAAQPAGDAEKFPQRPVRIVVVVSPGASSDMLTRTVARRLGEIWGKPVVVQNIPGANGNIGSRLVADAPPDGYTLVASGQNLSINANYETGLGLDPTRAYAAITQAVVNPIILVARNGLGPKTFNEYIAHAKKRNGELLFALTGLGSLHHIVNELVAQRTGTRYTYIPYKGGAPATADMLGGHNDAMLITLAAVTEHVRAGRLTAIAVTTKERSKALPEVPPLNEAGLPGFDIASWQGFLAPGRTPRPLVEKLYRDFAAALRSPEVFRFLEDQGYNVRATPPAETDRLIRSEVASYGQVIKAANLKLID